MISVLRMQAHAHTLTQAHAHTLTQARAHISHPPLSIQNTEHGQRCLQQEKQSPSQKSSDDSPRHFKESVRIYLHYKCLNRTFNLTKNELSFAFSSIQYIYKTCICDQHETVETAKETRSFEHKKYRTAEARFVTFRYSPWENAWLCE